MSLGENIRRLRNLRDWTLDELSERSGVEVGTISALENRRSSRSIHVGALAAAFDVSADELLKESSSSRDSEVDSTSELVRRRLAVALAKAGITKSELARLCSIEAGRPCSPQSVGSWFRTGRMDKRWIAVIERITETSMGFGGLTSAAQDVDVSVNEARYQEKNSHDLLYGYNYRLLEAMGRSKVDISQLAQALGLSYQAVRKVVNGESLGFGLVNHFAASDYLGLDPRWLALGEGRIMGQEKIQLDGVEYDFDDAFDKFALLFGQLPGNLVSEAAKCLDTLARAPDSKIAQDAFRVVLLEAKARLASQPLGRTAACDTSR
jgi:transcriptional regulator with XRE-family HTH domain